MPYLQPYTLDYLKTCKNVLESNTEHEGSRYGFLMNVTKSLRAGVITHEEMRELLGFE